MDYITLHKNLKDFKVFSINDIRNVDPGFQRRRLNDWQDKGYLKKVIKGFYIFTDLDLDEYTLFEIANKIYKPSYISLESALAFYNLIPESAYGLTSVSTRRTYRFDSPITNFSFRTVKNSLFFGYQIKSDDRKTYKIASPEKALLDYLYLNSHLKNGKDFADLRINAYIFFNIVKERTIKAFLKKYAQKSLSMRLAIFMDFMKGQRKNA